MAKSKRVGADVGNGNLKLWMDGYEDGLLISSIQNKLLTTIKENVMGIANISEDEIIDYLDVTFLSSPALKTTGEEERYAIGNYCISNFARGEEIKVESKKYEDDIPARTILAGLLYDAIRNNPNKKNVKAQYDLSMSLPLLDTRLDSYEKNQTRYIGQHVMKYHYPDGETEITVTIDIEFATTNPEGGIGAYAVVYDINGNPIQYEMEIMDEVFTDTLEEYPLLLVDIGSGTTELAASNGIKFDQRNSVGLPLGCRDTIREIYVSWNAKTENKNDQILNSAKFTNIYLDGRSYRKNKLRSHSKDYLYQFATDVVTEVSKHYKELTKIHGSDLRIPVFGGGSILIQHYLEELFEQENIASAVIFVDKPLFINARGSYIFSRMKAFEARKQKYLNSLKETVK